MDRSAIKCVIAQMTKFTTPFICLIYGIEDRTYGEQIGSGTLVSVYSNIYIITAAHVIKEINKKYNGCGVSFYCDDHIFILGPTCRLSHFLDVAMIPIDISELKCKQTPFLWDIDNSNCENIENDILYIHGNPALRSRFIAMDKAIHSESFPYATGLGKSSYKWFNPFIHFALQYPGSINKENVDSYVSLPDPHGLSGTGVWKLNVSGNDIDRLKPENAELVGVIHNWDPDCSSLIATKVEAIKQKKPSFQ